MKITSIKQQQKNKSRFSVFVDDKYAFSLNDYQVIETKIRLNQEISEPEIKKFLSLSKLGKIYDSLLQKVSKRLHSKKELSDWLTRKKIDEDEIEYLLQKLEKLGFINDKLFADSFARGRRDYKNKSDREIMAELSSKGVDGETINEAIMNLELNEQDSLVSLIRKKQRLSAYKDETKLIQFLLRKGYSYTSIKSAINSLDNQE